MNRPRDGCASRQMREDRGCVRQGLGHVAGVDPALETVARFGVQPVPSRGSPYPARLEIGALEHHALRRRADLARGASHDPCEGDRPFGVGDHEVVFGERQRGAVESLERLSGLRASHDDAPSADSVEVASELAVRKIRSRPRIPTIPRSSRARPA